MRTNFTKDLLERLYVVEKKSQSEIAAMFGCTRFTVLLWMRKLGVRSRKTSSVLLGTKFSEEHKRKISKSNTGKTTSEETREKLRRIYGPLHWAWKGGRRLKHGYVFVSIDRKYVAEHRLVMEKKIGRKLLKRESVHHLNGIKIDNKPSNLELWVSPQPSGQRVSDLVSFVVKNYRKEVVRALK